jgi:excinuclease ABC subunit A
MDVIKSADYVIDLGPEGGEAGGSLLFTGTPEELVKCKKSTTGQHLRL